MATEKQIDIAMDWWFQRNTSRLEPGKIIDKLTEESNNVH